MNPDVKASSNQATAAAPDTNRRMQILSVATRMFVEGGYRATSLQDVADVLGVTRPALYYYFTSKEELLYAILSFAQDVNEETTSRVFESTHDPGLRLARLIYAEVLDTTGEADSPVTPLMVDEMDELSPDHFRQVASRRRAHHDRHRGLLKELRAAGKLRDLDTTVATFGLLALITRVSRWFDPAGRLTGEQVALEVTKLALGALLADPAPVIAELDGYQAPVVPRD
jgi:AcrR family transcriptional regulator